MINRFLHALTNLKTLSINPIFSSDPNFIPVVLKPDEISMRQILQVTDQVDEYYLKRYVAVMASFPDLEDQLYDDVVTYDMKELRPRGITIDGGVFLHNRGYSRYLDFQVSQLPVPLTYVVEFVDGQTCRITQVETGSVVAVPCTVVSDPYGTILRISWPDGYPFIGALKTSQAWEDGCSITLHVEPTQFPYSDMVSKLQSNSAFVSLLHAQGLMAAFQNNEDDIEKLAVALLVIARSNPNVYAQ